MTVRRFIESGLVTAMVLLAASLPFSIAASQLSLGLLLLFWLANLVFDYRSDLLITPISWAFLAWMVAGLLAAVFGYQPSVSLLAMREEWLFLVFFAVWGGLVESSKWRTVVLVLAISSSLSSIYAVWQHYSGLDLARDVMLVKMVSGYRVLSTLSSYLTCGSVFCLIGIFLLPQVHSESGWRKHLILVSAILSLLTASLTYSRSALIAIAVGVLACLILLFRQLRWRVLIAPLLLAAAILLVQPDALFRFTRENPTSEQSKTYFDGQDKRWHIWGVAWRMFLDHPLTGVGQNQFLSHYESYTHQDSEECFAQAHNDILTVAASLGIAGLAAYFFIWVSLGRQLWRHYRRCWVVPARLFSATGLILICSYLAMSQFEAYFMDEEVRLTLFFLLGLLFSRIKLIRQTADLDTYSR